MNITHPDKLTNEIEYEHDSKNHLDFIRTFIHPTGLIERIFYNHRGHSLPEGAPISFVPFVSRYEKHPGMGQPKETRFYSYSAKNHLGYAGVSHWNPERDNTFYTSSNYEYSSVELLSNGVAIERFYNYYHLQTREVFSHNGAVFKTNEQTYFASIHLGIDDQPENYSYIKTATQTYTVNSENRTETEHYQYDQFGNETYKQEINGRSRTTIYYPAEGEIGKCPADPYGFVSKIKTITDSPASTSLGEKNRVDTFTWVLVPRANHQGSFISEKTATMSSGVSRSSELFDDPFNMTTYGMCKTLTTTIDDCVSSTEYDYTIADETLTLTTKHTSHDDLTRTKLIQYNLSHGMITKEVDSENVVKQTEYDDSGRVVLIDEASNTPYSRRLVYDYDNELNKLTITSPDQVRRTIYYDGRGKVIKKELESNDGTMNIVELRNYDNLGQLSELIEKDWFGSTSKDYITHFTYNVHGEVNASILPDGNTEINEDNPVTQKYRKGIEGLSITEVSYDIDENETQLDTYDSGGDKVSSTSRMYDGWGRLISEATSGGVRSYRYLNDGMSQPNEIVTPFGTVHDITFNPYLRKNEVMSVRGSLDSITYRYKNNYGVLEESANIHSSCIYTYDKQKNLLSERRKQHGLDKTSTYDFTVGGRLQNYIDYVGGRELQEYDEVGRNSPGRRTKFSHRDKV